MHNKFLNKNYQIYVRTWQSVKDENGEIFQLSDFKY